jgi:hypothetical protein
LAAVFSVLKGEFVSSSVTEIVVSVPATAEKGKTNLKTKVTY